MSTRSFFNLRETIPGFIFILIICLINIEPIRTFTGAEDVGDSTRFLVGVLTVFSGSTIGFLLSQLWWPIYHLGKLHYFDVWPRFSSKNCINLLIEKYRLTEDTSIGSVRNVISVFGFIIHYQGTEKKYETLFTYSTRRWDVYHLLSLTKISVILSSIFGYILRFYILSNSLSYWEGNIPNILIFMNVLAQILLFIGTLIVSHGWDTVSIALIKACKLDYIDLLHHFPLHFFNVIRLLDDEKFKLDFYT